MNHRLSRVAFAIVALPALVAAQPRWIQLTPSASPTPRTEMTVGEAPGGFYVFGGETGTNTWSDELWYFSGWWTKQPSPPGTPTPPARRGAAGAYDSSRSRFVMIGGYDAIYYSTVGVKNALSDHWEWDGTRWHQLVGASKPSPRAYAAMTYDAKNRRCVLFGGMVGTGCRADTYVLDARGWSPLTIATSPKARARAAIAAHPSSGEILMFGGGSDLNALTVQGDTWRFKDSAWTQVSTTTIPGGSGLLGAEMIYDEARQRFVLFGGRRSNLTMSNDVWEFDGIDWQKRTPPSPLPAARTDAAIAYIPLQRRTILFGGSAGALANDTWQYSTNAPARFREFGTGCAASTGIPVQHALEWPWIGGHLAMEVQNAPANALTYLVTGWRQVNYPLLPHTRPECVLIADPLFISVLADDPVSGRPTLSVPIPYRTSLLGVTLYTQAGVLESGPGIAGGVSACGYMTFGAR